MPAASVGLLPPASGALGLTAGGAAAPRESVVGNYQFFPGRFGLVLGLLPVLDFGWWSSSFRKCHRSVTVPIVLDSRRGPGNADPFAFSIHVDEDAEVLRGLYCTAS